MMRRWPWAWVLLVAFYFAMLGWLAWQFLTLMHPPVGN